MGSAQVTATFNDMNDDGYVRHRWNEEAEESEQMGLMRLITFAITISNPRLDRGWVILSGWPWNSITKRKTRTRTYYIHGLGFIIIAERRKVR